MYAYWGLEAQDLVFVIWRIENYFIYLWVQLTSKSGHPIKVFSHLLMKMVTLWGFYLYVRFRMILSVGTPHIPLLLCIPMHYLEIKVLWQIKMSNPCLVGVNMIPANLWYPDNRSNVLHHIVSDTPLFVQKSCPYLCCVPAISWHCRCKPNFKCVSKVVLLCCKWSKYYNLQLLPFVLGIRY